ncbi:MAG: signal peptidase II [Chloroflexota bacterium]|nr:signal peptidase II [Chloroflexota bacterium]
MIVVDLASKQLAASLLAGGDVPLGGTVRLALVYNNQSAFGFSLGAYTWLANVALTLAAIVLVISVSRELTAIDTAAPYALGLISGAALGNLISLLASPIGVIDFLAIDYGGGHELVLNLADIAAYIGLALLAQPAWVVLRALLTERGMRRELPAVLALGTSAHERIYRAEVEVQRAVCHEPPTSSPRGQVSPGDRVRSGAGDLPPQQQRISAAPPQ